MLSFVLDAAQAAHAFGECLLRFLSLHPTDPQTGCQWTSGNSLRTLLREGIVPIVRAVIKLEIRGPHNLTEDLPSAQT